MKETMRIAMLGHKRIPSREGGVEIVVEELSTAMVRKGHAVTCYNRRGHHISGAQFDKKKQKQYCGVRMYTVPTIDRKGLAAMTSSFFGALRAAFGRYDVVHFHAEGPCAMMWLPKLFGKRCIATIHGLDHQRGKWGKFAKWYILRGEKCAVKRANEIIVLSRGAQQYFLDTYGRETVLIPNGVRKAQQLPAKEITARWGLEKGEYILFLGRLVPEKGVHYLLEAYKQAQVDQKLVIAGGTSDTDEYVTRLLQMAGDDEKIIFTDFVEGDTLKELYSNAYLYVLPSDLEGMPLSLLEAMSYGNCCLTSDITECTDVTGPWGYSFPKGNVAALQEQLKFLCSQPAQVEACAAGAAEHVCRLYNWDDITDKTLRLYEKKQKKEAQVEA